MPVLIIPGLNGSEREHWQSHWEREMPDACRVVQANWARPERDVWALRLIEEIERRPGSVLVGHSLGATLVVHVASLRPDLPIGGALLAAPADPSPRRTDAPGVGSFSPLPTTPLPFPTIVAASRNDLHMAQIRAMHLAKLWGATFMDAGAAGHINVASGHTRWPEGRLLLQSLRAPLLPVRRVAEATDSGVVVPLRRRPRGQPPIGDRLAAP